MSAVRWRRKSCLTRWKVHRMCVNKMHRRLIRSRKLFQNQSRYRIWYRSQKLNLSRKLNQNRRLNLSREPSQNRRQNPIREPSQNRQQNPIREPSQNR